MRGIHIKLKDGNEEWIDPVESNGLVEDSKELKVTNEYHTYVYKREEYISWSEYPLCERCKRGVHEDDMYCNYCDAFPEQ